MRLVLLRLGGSIERLPDRVSEIFPLEIRSQAISYFFALAQIFGSVAPLLFGVLIGDGTDRGPLIGATSSAPGS